MIMRKITAKATEHFLSAKEFSQSNTQVKVKEWVVSLYLHGNKIAYYPKGLKYGMFISLAGWNTVTTKERLKGITRVFTKKWKTYYENYRKRPIEITDENAFYSIYKGTEE